MRFKTLTKLLLAAAFIVPAPYALPVEAKTTKRKASTNSKYTRYKGTVGKYKVTMFLDKNHNGYYYYGNGSKGKLTIKGYETGEFCGAACLQLNLYEYDPAGNCTATWDVEYVGMTISPGHRVWHLYGEMTTNGRTYEVDLWPE